MSNCGCNPWDTGTLSTKQVCGDFDLPENPDQGRCGPYRVKIPCDAPVVQFGRCPGEVAIAIPNPNNPSKPFSISTGLYDEDCLPIFDEDGVQVQTIIY